MDWNTIAISALTGILSISGIIVTHLISQKNKPNEIKYTVYAEIMKDNLRKRYDAYQSFISCSKDIYHGFDTLDNQKTSLQKMNITLNIDAVQYRDSRDFYNRVFLSKVDLYFTIERNNIIYPSDASKKIIHGLTSMIIKISNILSIWANNDFIVEFFPKEYENLIVALHDKIQQLSSQITKEIDYIHSIKKNKQDKSIYF